MELPCSLGRNPSPGMSMCPLTQPCKNILIANWKGGKATMSLQKYNVEFKKVVFRVLPWQVRNCGWDGKESVCNVGDLGSIPGLGRFPEGGHGNPLQYSCVENPHGAWRLQSMGSQRDGHDWVTEHIACEITKRSHIFRECLYKPGLSEKLEKIRNPATMKELYHSCWYQIASCGEENASFILLCSFDWSNNQINIRKINKRETNLISHIPDKRPSSLFKFLFRKRINHLWNFDKTKGVLLRVAN